jgi:hypothetical protein
MPDITSADLDKFIERSKREGFPHMIPIWNAAKTGVKIIMLNKLTNPSGATDPALDHVIKNGRPWIAIIGDDMPMPDNLHTCYGPEAYPCKDDLAKAAHFIAVLCADARQWVYEAAALSATLLGRNTLIVESDHQFEQPWMEWVRPYSREKPVIMGIVGDPKAPTH